MPVQEKIQEKIVRHRFLLRDAMLIGMPVIALLMLSWWIDLFPRAVEWSARIKPDEAMAVIALGLALFAGTRVNAQRRERRSRIAAERTSRALAMEDALTGLANRRRFDGALRHVGAARPGLAHGVFMLDLNGFKKINDVHGHPIGDEVLVEIGARLRKAVRAGDLVARLGGDEFAILAPNLAGESAAAALAQRMVELIDVPVRTRAMAHPVAAAIGIALMPRDGDRAEVLRKADIALYRAKGGSRSAVRFFEEEMDDQVRARDAIEWELRAALDADLIQPYFQPHIDLTTGEVIGFEALARWHHPTLGDMPPDQFISVAGDCGLIGQLTDQLLRRACATALRWPDHVLLSFNIAPGQLRDPRLARG